MLYTFKAKKISGEELAGERESQNKRDLARVLREDGYILISATEKEESAPKGFSIPFAAHGLAFIVKRVPLQEKLNFARNLSVMIRAGLPLTRALDTLERQTSSAAFKPVINDITNNIRKGESFSDSLKRHPRIFPSLFVAMIAAGEMSGKMDESLNVLATQMKNDYELRRKVRGALMYPGVIMCVMVIIAALMLIYVVPTLTSVFADMKVELPASTRAIISISNFLLTRSILALSILLVFAFAAYMILRTKAAKNAFDVLLIRLPVIGTIARQLNAARTARTMSSLISSGVSILQTLAITRDVLQNHLFKQVLDEAGERIQQGETMTGTFNKHTNLYPVLMGEMIAVGEETGKTSEMLVQLAEFYESEVAAATKDLSSIIEPILMVVIGAVVGLFAVSMIQPLYTSIATGF